MEKVLFKEEQKFNQWWLWGLLIFSFLAATLPFIFGIYSQEVLGKPFGNKPMSTAGLIVMGSISAFVMGLVLLLIYKAKLITKITNEGIFVRYPPLIIKEKKIVPEEIERFEVRTFRANREFGGYGVKSKGKKYGQSYTISGNQGLQLYFKNGKKLLIGTQRKQAVEYAMEKLMKPE